MKIFVSCEKHIVAVLVRLALKRPSISNDFFLFTWRASILCINFTARLSVRIKTHLPCDRGIGEYVLDVVQINTSHRHIFARKILAMVPGG